MIAHEYPEGFYHSWYCIYTDWFIWVLVRKITGRSHGQKRKCSFLFSADDFYSSQYYSIAYLLYLWKISLTLKGLKNMQVDDFDFYLPEHLIAQNPLKSRSSSRLLILNRKKKAIKHEMFHHIKDYFQKGDCLVLNNTRVLPARLYGIKENTGAKVEILLLHERTKDVWETLVKPARRINENDVLTFGEGLLRATCIGVKEHGGRLFQMDYNGEFLEVIETLGEMPLPPYIKKDLQEQERYQTVYAKIPGSAAAPTAGLHFTEKMLTEIKALGVEIIDVTLHIGLGTFRPVHAKYIKDHKMHEEYYELSKESAERLNDAKRNGNRVIAVGTTATRVLETIAKENEGYFKETQGWTDIFIYPPYTFQAIDGLITNFHLPKSTLFMLVSAFVDRETMLKTYEEAIQKEYRFFSFGDAMFITG